jgi:hypothetical protein
MSISSRSAVTEQQRVLDAWSATSQDGITGACSRSRYRMASLPRCRSLMPPGELRSLRRTAMSLIEQPITDWLIVSTTSSDVVETINDCGYYGRAGYQF